MRFPVALAIVALMIPFGADAQEAISTAAAEDPGPSVPVAAGEEDPGDWARRVLAGQPAPPDPQDPPGKGCAASGATERADGGKPHGEVWAGVGTRGYREIGGVVTQPLGKCGSVTIGVSKTEGDFGGRWRRR